MELTVEQALQRGVEAHKEGKLQEAERLYRIILQSQPLHPDANHNLGLIAVSVNKSSAALALFKTALEANPTVDQFWFSYIDALFKETKLENAKQVIERAKTQGVDEEKLNIFEAQLVSKKEQTKTSQANSAEQQLGDLLACYEAGRLADAERLAMFLTKKFPKYSLPWKVLGAVLGHSGRNSEAVDANLKAIALSPEDAELYSNLGISQQKLGKLDEAEASYARAIELEPDYAENYCNLANTLKGLGKLDDAEASYARAIALKPKFFIAHSNLGITLQELGRLHEAETSFKRAIEIEPDYAEAHYNLGTTLKKLDRLDEAEACLKNALLLKPNYAEAHNSLGVMLLELGRLHEAETNFKKAIESKPDFAEAYSNLGITLQRLGRLDEAEMIYKKAIVLEPDFAEAHNNLGVTLKELRRLDEAEASLKNAILFKPNYAEAYNSFGVILYELNRLDEAETNYRNAIALKPDYAEAHTNLGINSYSQGKIDAAIDSLKKARDIDPRPGTSELVLSVLRARKARETTELGFDSENKTNQSLELNTNPLFLNRTVEPELVLALLEMQSRDMDKATNTPVFGNGRCSLDYNMFDSNSPILKTVERDLVNLLEAAVKANIYLADSFFNIYSAGAGIPPHTHLIELDQNKYLKLAKQKFSLVYYISVGDQDCSEPGIFKLYDPEEEILPSDGMILIIPAGRRHSAVYNGKKDRIIIGVNFYAL